MTSAYVLSDILKIMTNIKYFSLMAMVIILFFINFYQISNLHQSKVHPTQEEWLKVYIAHNVRKTTDLWGKRVAVNVDIFINNADGKILSPKEIVVTILSANGETLIKGTGIDQYNKTVEGIVNSILEDYGLTKDYKLIVNTVG